MKIKHQKTKKAFTLIEVLLYVSLTSIILITISAFLGTILSTRARNQAISEVDQQATQLMQTITNTIKDAATVNTPTAGNTGSSLSLGFTEGSLDPTVIDVDSEVIRIQEGAGSPIDLSSNKIVVDELEFTNLSSGGVESVRVEFTLSFYNPGNRQEFNVTQTYYGTATLR